MTHLGQIVVFVLDEGPNAGQSRPAIVVNDWGLDYPGTFNLHVFPDGDGTPSNDMLEPPPLWKGSVPYDPSGKQPYSWHFREEHPSPNES